jgi:hypothetical protein
MGGEGGAEVFDEGGIVGGGVVVGNAQDDDRFIGEVFGEFLAEAVGVFALHAEDAVGPAEVAGGDFDACAVFGAGGAGVVARVVFEQRLGGGGAPLVARAEEEEFGFYDQRAWKWWTGPWPWPTDSWPEAAMADVR